MKIKRFGDPAGKKIMLLHRQNNYTTAQKQTDQLEAYLLKNCSGILDLLYAESLG